MKNSTANKRLSSKKILIAEDNQEMRNLLSISLTNEGYQVETAANGIELISALSNLNNIDLVVSDIKMPGATGLQILSALKKQKIGSNPPVFLITAFGEKQTIESALSLGAVDVLSKPFEMEELVCRVDQYFNKQKEKHIAYLWAFDHVDTSSDVRVYYLLGDENPKIVHLSEKKARGIIQRVGNVNFVEVLFLPKPASIEGEYVGLVEVKVTGKGFNIFETDLIKGSTDLQIYAALKQVLNKLLIQLRVHEEKMSLSTLSNHIENTPYDEYSVSKRRELIETWHELLKEKEPKKRREIYESYQKQAHNFHWHKLLEKEA